jgi:hypothetical protein
MWTFASLGLEPATRIHKIGANDQKFTGKFGFIPLKDHHFGSIPLLSHLHVGPHESMTCGIHGIYLKFGSFNGIDPIVPNSQGLAADIASAGSHAAAAAGASTGAGDSRAPLERRNT